MYTLMNGDIPVLNFDFEDMYIELLNNDFLPYELKDYIKTTDYHNIKKSMRDIECVKDFFVSRTLNLARDHAKEILNCAALPQRVDSASKLKITFACRGLSITDNFWIKEDYEDITFSQVNLRENKLSDASYHIAIIGKHISVTADEVRPDLSTSGMFPKYWSRESGKLSMWKSDMTTGNVNTNAEIEASVILRTAGANALEYVGIEKDDRLFAVSECMSDNDYSLVTATAVKDWCEHTGRNFMEFIHENFLAEFANMCVADYVIANTDRHNDNWCFMVNNHTNNIVGFAKLHDHNQSLIADCFGTDIKTLKYEPLDNKTFTDAVNEYARYSFLDFDKVKLNEKCRMRWEEAKQIKELSKENSEDLEQP